MLCATLLVVLVQCLLLLLFGNRCKAFKKAVGSILNSETDYHFVVNLRSNQKCL